MSKIEELKAYVPIMGMIECEDSCGTYLEKDDVVALISDFEQALAEEGAMRMSHEAHIEKLEKQLAEAQEEAANGKAAVEAMGKIKHANSNSDCYADFTKSVQDIIEEYQEAVCKK